MSIRFGWTRPQAGQQSSDDELVQDATSASPDIGAQPAPPVNPTGAALMQGQNDNITSGSGSKESEAPPAPPTSSSPPALPTAPTTPTPTPPTPSFSQSALQAVWDAHARVVDAERKTHRRLGGSGARRAYNDALVEEESALGALGFENFEAFAARFGEGPDAEPSTTVTAATDASDEGEPAGETIGRIRVLLAELGIDPGGDPLE